MPPRPTPAVAACERASLTTATPEEKRSGEIRGRAALADMIERFVADPQWLRVRIPSPIDAAGTTFNFRAAIDRHDGSTLELFDAGDIDDTGRIALILTFVDPFAHAGQTSR